MGHIVEENVVEDRREELDRFKDLMMEEAEAEGDGWDPDELVFDHAHVYANKALAIQALDRMESDVDSANVAVRFHDNPASPKDTIRLDGLKEHVDHTLDRLQTIARTIDLRNEPAKRRRTCKACGSIITMSFMQPNHTVRGLSGRYAMDCPVCGHTLLTQTQQRQLDAAVNAHEHARQSLEHARTQALLEEPATGPIRWLIRTDYHC